MKYDVIVIGGGAAGLFCAIEAGKRGRNVLVIEHNGAVGRKIVISGGGRCNFTNLDVSAENFISANPHFCKSALAGYTPNDFIKLVERYRIEYYEKTLGQLFCRDSSRQIVEMLLAECERAGVTIKTECSVTKVELDVEGRWELETNRGPFTCGALVIATGGLSFPKVGATDFGYRVARQFGLKITQTRPSLVAMTFAGESRYAQLSGVSVPAAITANGHEFRENILFTHRGLSGPAVLQASNYWQPGNEVSIDLLPDTDATELISERVAGQVKLADVLSTVLPRRFAETFAANELPKKPMEQLSKRELELVAERLNGWKVDFSGTEGYARAEVTLGGVSTAELSSQTMETKRVPGLYFIGEVVDVTGWLGGYNFQWAWASGFAAGHAV